MTTDYHMRGALRPRTFVLLVVVAGGSWSIWHLASPDARITASPIIGPAGLSVSAVSLVPAPRAAATEVAPMAPTALEPPAPARVFALPKDEYFEALSRPFTPPTFEDFKRAIERKTEDAGLATALWQITAVRKAYVTHEHGFYMLMFVLGYYEREVMRASYSLASVPLATDLGDVGRFLLANAADRDAMRAALDEFESAVDTAVKIDEHEETYNSEEFRNIRDRLEIQIRAVPCSVEALQVLRDSIK